MTNEEKEKIGIDVGDPEYWPGYVTKKMIEMRPRH